MFIVFPIEISKIAPASWSAAASGARRRFGNEFGRALEVLKSRTIRMRCHGHRTPARQALFQGESKFAERLAVRRQAKRDAALEWHRRSLVPFQLLSHLPLVAVLVFAFAFTASAQTPPPAAYVRSFVNDMPNQPLVTVSVSGAIGHHLLHHRGNSARRRDAVEHQRRWRLSARAECSSAGGHILTRPPPT